LLSTPSYLITAAAAGCSPSTEAVAGWSQRIRCAAPGRMGILLSNAWAK